jgi:hypothetical protein
MPCRNDPDAPGKCERCGASLWVAEEGLYCGECGSVMPCAMRVMPAPVLEGKSARSQTR